MVTAVITMVRLLWLLLTATMVTVQHLGLDSEAELIEKVDQEAFISLVKMKILPAQEYQMWANRANLSEVVL